MKIKARIQKILEVQTGTSKAGREWKKQAFIVTQFNSFKDDLYCEMWNKDIDLLTVRKEGETVEMELLIKSREWNGKYYTNVNCSLITPVNDEEEEEEITPF